MAKGTFIQLAVEWMYLSLWVPNQRVPLIKTEKRWGKRRTTSHFLSKAIVANFWWIQIGLHSICIYRFPFSLHIRDRLFQRTPTQYLLTNLRKTILNTFHYTLNLFVIIFSGKSVTNGKNNRSKFSSSGNSLYVKSNLERN